MSQPKLIGAALALTVAAGTFIYVQAQGSQTTSQGSQMKAQGGQSKEKESQSKAKTRGGHHRFVEIDHSNCGLVDPTQDTITLHKGLQDDVAWVLDVGAPSAHRVIIKFNQGPCDQGDVFLLTKDTPSAYCTIGNAQLGKYKYRVFDKKDQACGPDPSVDVQP
jgi:hypothetical protein